jgi:hypothetical protein
VIVRRAVRIVALVAAIVVVALPIVQLPQTFMTCCCPDPSDCHCPKESGARDLGTPTMRACHHEAFTIVNPAAPAFVATRLALPSRGAPRLAPPLAVARDPHQAPDPRRPSAPS